VPIRNKVNHELLPGVTIGDMGAKVGNDQIDNGFLIFKNMRVPYDNMCDRFSSINEKGEFTSPIENPDKRFAYCLGALTGGRITLVNSSNNMLINALTIATRFTHVRRQFGAPNQPETVLIEYPLVQSRLIPYFAFSFAMAFGNAEISNYWNDNQDKIFDEKNHRLAEIHALSSSLKAWTTWTTQRGLQECREMCGGLGYSAYNRLGSLREDHDVNCTWEGDNNVLLQQTGKFLLDCLRKLSKGKKLPFQSAQFLNVAFNADELQSELSGESKWAKGGKNLQEAFQIRANYWAHELAKAVMEETQKVGDPLLAWNNVQVPYVKKASFAFIELYMYNEFAATIKTFKQ